MRVLVIGLNGRGLSPTTPRKARVLVDSKKAEVVCRVPYTIKLLYKTGVAGEKTDLGIDTGSQHIGVSVVSGDKAVIKAEFALRSTMEKRSLTETRASYRRGRRYRKTRYRHPKFKPKTRRYYSEAPVRRNKHLTNWVKKKNEFASNRNPGWLPPSVESKVQHNIRIISKFLSALPDKTTLHIEVARFDVARIKDPDIHGEMYQKGPMYDHENINAYIFERDGYKCRVCHSKAGSKRKDGSVVKLIGHHVDFRSKGATDNPDRMASVCDRCHTPLNHTKGHILYEWMEKGKKFKRGYRDCTFMNILRFRLRKAFPDAVFTYGNITKADREKMHLKKTHANDAVAIACGGRAVDASEETVYYQQVRSRKRSLHEANPRKGRKEPNRTAWREPKNTKSVDINKNGRTVTFHIYDRVSLNGKTGWISGFTGTSAYVRDENGDYIKYEGKNYNQVSISNLAIISNNNNWLVGAKAPIGK